MIVSTNSKCLYSFLTFTKRFNPFDSELHEFSGLILKRLLSLLLTILLLFLTLS